MSDRDPESDWEQPRGDFSRGGGPHYSGDPYGDPTAPLAASSWQRNHGWIIGLVVGGVLLAAGLAVFFLLAT